MESAFIYFALNYVFGCNDNIEKYIESINKSYDKRCGMKTMAATNFSSIRMDNSMWKGK